MKLGDGIAIAGMLIWLSVSVGPWWLGAVLFVVAWWVNVLMRRG
jgi:hypothetical protein